MRHTTEIIQAPHFDGFKFIGVRFPEINDYVHHGEPKHLKPYLWQVCHGNSIRIAYVYKKEVTAQSIWDEIPVGAVIKYSLFGREHTAVKTSSDMLYFVSYDCDCFTSFSKTALELKHNLVSGDYQILNEQ